MTEREDSYIAGTKIGGAKAAATNKARHGADYYAVLGRRGGKNGCYANNPYYTGGFAGNRELAREAGRRGGKVSRRGKAGSHKIRVKQIESTDEVLEIHTDWGERHTDREEDMSGHTVDVDAISQKIAVNYGDVIKKLEEE